MNRKSFLVGLLAAGCFVATSTLMTSPGNAQGDPKVAKAMAILKAETAKLGAPKVEGTDQTADKATPGAYPPMCRAAYTAGRLGPSWILREKR
jgi:hypothetical protein